MHKIANIVNFRFLYICSFFLFLLQMVWIDVNLDVSGCKGITFQGFRL